MSLFKLRLFNPRYVRLFSSEHSYIPRGVTPFHIKQQENLMINQILNENKDIDNEKWTKIRKELFESRLPITELNIDSAIVDRCYDSCNATAALNYIKYLIATDHDLNIATVGKFFKALYEVNRPLNEEEINLIFKFYDDIIAKYSILDSQTAQYCILALSITKRWREYVELLKMAKYSGHTSSKVYSAIVAAAFNNDDPDIGWEVMRTMLPKLRMNIRLFESYLNYSIRNSNNPEKVEHHLGKMFEFWSDYDYYPSFEIVQIYGNYLRDTGEWNVSPTEIKTNGSCSVCGHKLSNFQITEKDFDVLKKTFFSKVVVGGDVYINTTPQELRIFQKFVDSTKPYDVVIDGLNAAYLSHTKGKMNHAEELARVVKAFASQNKKIFVLGRKHMSRWPPGVMDYVKTNAYLFLANDLSKDDPFLLHAALSSGVKTYLASADFMRQHKFNLPDDQMRRTFRHWQLSRQIVPTYVGIPQNRQLLLVYPPNVLPIAQMSQNGDWHIPYNEEGVEKELQPAYKPKMWLCLHKKKRSH